MARFVLLCFTCLVFRDTLWMTHGLQSNDACPNQDVRTQDVNSLLQAYTRHQQPAVSLQQSKKKTEENVDANAIGYNQAATDNLFSDGDWQICAVLKNDQSQSGFKFISSDYTDVDQDFRFLSELTATKATVRHFGNACAGLSFPAVLKGVALASTGKILWKSSSTAIDKNPFTTEGYAKYEKNLAFNVKSRFSNGAAASSGSRCVKLDNNKNQGSSVCISSGSASLSISGNLNGGKNNGVYMCGLNKWCGRPNNKNYIMFMYKAIATTTIATTTTTSTEAATKNAQAKAKAETQAKAKAEAEAVDDNPCADCRNPFNNEVCVNAHDVIGGWCATPSDTRKFCLSSNNTKTKDCRKGAIKCGQGPFTIGSMWFLKSHGVCGVGTGSTTHPLAHACQCGTALCPYSGACSKAYRDFDFENYFDVCYSIKTHSDTTDCKVVTVVAFTGTELEVHCHNTAFSSVIFDVKMDDLCEVPCETTADCTSKVSIGFIAECANGLCKANPKDAHTADDSCPRAKNGECDEMVFATHWTKGICPAFTDATDCTATTSTTPSPPLLPPSPALPGECPSEVEAGPYFGTRECTAFCKEKTIEGIPFVRGQKTKGYCLCRYYVQGPDDKCKGKPTEYKTSRKGLVCYYNVCKMKARHGECSWYAQQEDCTMNQCEWSVGEFFSECKERP